MGVLCILRPLPTDTARLSTGRHIFEGFLYFFGRPNPYICVARNVNPVAIGRYLHPLVIFCTTFTSLSQQQRSFTVMVKRQRTKPGLAHSKDTPGNEPGLVTTDRDKYKSIHCFSKTRLLRLTRHGLQHACTWLCNSPKPHLLHFFQTST